VTDAAARKIRRFTLLPANSLCIGRVIAEINSIVPEMSEHVFSSSWELVLEAGKCQGTTSVVLNEAHDLAGL